MNEVNQRPPEQMTPEQRRAELGVLLARGIARVRAESSQKSANRLSEGQFRLGFSGHQSVHRDTVNYGITESL